MPANYLLKILISLWFSAIFEKKELLILKYKIIMMNAKMIFFSLPFLLIFSGCNNKETAVTAKQSDSTSLLLQGNDNQKMVIRSSASKSESNRTNIEQLKTETYRLNGGNSIKNVELKNGKATITYIKNFKEYKKLNPQSGLTESDLKSYWSTDDAIKKMLVGSPARIMKNLDFINEVKIILPFKNKTYQIDVKKSELIKFTGKSMIEIKSDWANSFADPYIYNKEGREKFFKKFGNPS